MSDLLKPRKIGFTQLSQLLTQYERKYNLSTIEFFGSYLSGELGDDDDFMMWAGMYHLYLTSQPVRKFTQRRMRMAA